MGVPASTVSPAWRYISIMRDAIGDTTAISTAGSIRPIEGTVVSIAPVSAVANSILEAFTEERSIDKSHAIRAIVANDVELNKMIFLRLARMISCLGSGLSIGVDGF